MGGYLLSLPTHVHLACLALLGMRPDFSRKAFAPLSPEGAGQKVETRIAAAKG